MSRRRMISLMTLIVLIVIVTVQNNHTVPLTFLVFHGNVLLPFLFIGLVAFGIGVGFYIR